MRSFKDNCGREWGLSLTVRSGKRVRDDAGVDLFNMFDREEKGFGFITDVIKLVDVLWIMVREQAEKTGITDIQFGESMVGDSITTAQQALIDCVIDFMPEAKKKIYLELVAKVQKMEALSVQRATKATAALDPEQMLEKILIGMKKRTDTPV